MALYISLCTFICIRCILYLSLLHPTLTSHSLSHSPTTQVQTSCGYAVPFLATKPDPEDSAKQIPYLHDRDTLGHWGSKQIDAGTIHAYRAKNNAYSLDGLPGMRRARRDKGDMIWYSEVKARMKPRGYRSVVEMVLIVGMTVLCTVVGMWMMGLTRFDGGRW